MAPAGLIEARALQQRVDRKYLLRGRLGANARACAPDYCLLRAGQQVWARYESIYFDTPGRSCFTPIAVDCGRDSRFGFVTISTASSRFWRSSARSGAAAR